MSSKNQDKTDTQGHTLRHLIPANILQAKELMLVQLKSLKSVIKGSTKDRVSQTGFFLGSNSSDTFKLYELDNVIPF